MKRYINIVFIILIFAISSVQADNVKEGKKLAFDRKAVIRFNLNV